MANQVAPEQRAREAKPQSMCSQRHQDLPHDLPHDLHHDLHHDSHHKENARQRNPPQGRPRQQPDPTLSGWPPGIPYIIGNEGCERFSYYGMRAILWVYVAGLYQNVAGLTEAEAGGQATATVHFFITAVYALPMLGALIADRLLGKYRTIFWLSLVYCLGHLALWLFEDPLLQQRILGDVWIDPVAGLYIGLGLIAVGSGGIKPCVSAHVGDQFGSANWHLLSKVYNAFYFIINAGSVGATLLIPVIKADIGVGWAFALPGLLMGLATVIFWAGRRRFVHVPARPGGYLGMLDVLIGSCFFMTWGSLFFTKHLPWPAMLLASSLCLLVSLLLLALRQRLKPDTGILSLTLYGVGLTFLFPATAETATDGGGRHAHHWFFGAAARRFGEESVAGPIAVLRIVSIFLLVSIFWALFDQHISTWIRQATMMQRTIDLGWLAPAINRWRDTPWSGHIEILPSQVPSLNPLLVMLLIPFASFILYPALNRLGYTMTPLRRMGWGMFVAGFAFAAVAVIQSAIDTAGVGNIHIAWQVIPYTIMTLAEVMISITGLEFAYTQAPKEVKSTIMGCWLLTVALGNALVGLLASLASWELVDFFWLFAGLMALAGTFFAICASFYQYQDNAQAVSPAP